MKAQLKQRLNYLAATLTASISAGVFGVDQICFVLYNLWSLNVFIGPESGQCLPLSDLHDVPLAGEDDSLLKAWELLGSSLVTALFQNWSIA